MIQKFIQWYINKHWKNQYILKSDIQSALSLSKQNEAKRLNELFDIEKESLIQHMDLDKQLVVGELKAELKQMQSEMNDLLIRIKDAEAVYYSSIRRTKANDRVAQDMGIQAKSLMLLAGQIHGAVEGIKDRANNHLKEVEKEDKSERQKLRLPMEDK